MIDLVDCISVKPDDNGRKPSAFLVVTRDESVCMHASNDNEREDWLSAIGK